MAGGNFPFCLCKNSVSWWENEDYTMPDISRKDLENRSKMLFKQLEVMNLLKEEFLEKLGKQGYEQRIDDILDDILQIKKLLREMDNNS